MEDGDFHFGVMDDSQSRESVGVTNESLGDHDAGNTNSEQTYKMEEDSSSRGAFEWDANQDSNSVAPGLNGASEDSRQSINEASVESSNRKRSHTSSPSGPGGVMDDDSEAALKRLKMEAESIDIDEGKIWSALDPVTPDLTSSQISDLEKFWKPVMENPKEFQAWTSLLQYVDHESDVAAAREAYDLFLRRYPYCYGYWKKWADYEKKKASRKDCERVFEMGISAIPLSVDLWLHYLSYCQTQHSDQQAFVREQFERAVAACGLEFRSDRLWEMYINWEVERDDLKRVFQIYDRLLAIPTQFHATHWENFQDLINQNDPKELLSTTEYEELKKEATRSKKSHSDETEGSKSKDDVSKSIRNKLRDRRLKVRIQTEKEITERQTFEESIKRPYFHVKPLEKGQLKNWKSYLEFELERGNQSRIQVLFERCLVACALYEEYWVMYAKYLESRYQETPSDGVRDLLRDVYRRACTIHVPDKPQLYLTWSVFEERIGKFSRAERVLDLLELAAPELDTLVIRRVNLARRQGQHDRVIELYRHYIGRLKDAKKSIASFSIRASRFAQRVLENDVLAEEFLQEALQLEAQNTRLYLQLFDLRCQKIPVDVTFCLEALDKAVYSELDQDTRSKFARRKVEFLEDFGAEIAAVKEAEAEYEKLAKLDAQHQTQATDAIATDAGRAKTDGTAAGAYDASYAGYGSASAGYQGYPGYQQGWGGYPQYGTWGQGYYQQPYGGAQ